MLHIIIMKVFQTEQRAFREGGREVEWVVCGLCVCVWVCVCVECVELVLMFTLQIHSDVLYRDERTVRKGEGQEGRETQRRHAAHVSSTLADRDTGMAYHGGVSKRFRCVCFYKQSGRDRCRDGGVM